VDARQAGINFRIDSHSKRLPLTNQIVMSEFGEEMEAETRLNSTSTASSLSSIALSDVCFDQATDLAFFIESVFQGEIIEVRDNNISS
jgi:hypothetical protein